MNRIQVIEQLPALRRYARVLTGDAWAADDLVQDTLERACSKWLLWRTGSDLRAWLFTLMHNLYLNQRRALPPVQALDIDEVQDQLPGTPSRSDDALDLERCPVEGAFTGAQVREAIAGHVLGQASITGSYTLNRRLGAGADA